MENLMNRIKDEIKGEQLLFKEVGAYEYDDHEKKLMVKAVSNRISKQSYYIDLITLYIRKLISIICDMDDIEDLEDDIMTIGLETGKYNNKSYYQKEEDLDFVSFNMNVAFGYGIDESYVGIITKRLLDVDKVKQSFDDESAVDEYSNNTDFLITNNFLLIRYPEFYKESYLEQLEILANQRNRKEFSSRKEYSEFKKVAKTTMCNVTKAKEKGLIKIKQKSIK